MAEQKFTNNPKKIKDISVDTSVMTESGYYPKVAFLTWTGEIFVADLCECKKPTLFFVAQRDMHYYVRHFFYNAGRVFIVYNNSNGDICEWEDNSGLPFLRMLSKK